jgi:hypothetical protein
MAHTYHGPSHGRKLPVVLELSNSGPRRICSAAIRCASPGSKAPTNPDTPHITRLLLAVDEQIEAESISDVLISARGTSPHPVVPHGSASQCARIKSLPLHRDVIDLAPAPEGGNAPDAGPRRLARPI